MARSTSTTKISQRVSFPRRSPISSSTTTHSPATTPSTTSPWRSSSPKKAGSLGVGWNAGLNVEHVEHVLCEVVPPYLPEGANVRRRFRGLAKRSREAGTPAEAKAELAEVADWISSLLSQQHSTQQDQGDAVGDALPAYLVSTLHSHVGLIRELHGNTKAAIRSYTQAVWLLHKVLACNCSLQKPETVTANKKKAKALGKIPFSNLPTIPNLDKDDSHSADPDDEEIEEEPMLVHSQEMGVALYRLGTAYGRLGDFGTMQQLLGKADQYYNGEAPAIGCHETIRPRRTRGTSVGGSTEASSSSSHHGLERSRQDLIFDETEEEEEEEDEEEE